MLDPVVVSQAVDEMCLLKFAPAEGSRPALVRMLTEMCASDEQVKWLAKRCLKLFDAWPGPRELRAVFCSKFRPKDGEEVGSDVYPDGVPSEIPARNSALIGPPKERRRIAGEVSPEPTTADAQAQAIVNDLAERIKQKARAANLTPTYSRRVENDKAVYELSCLCGHSATVAVPVDARRFTCPGECGAAYEQWRTLSGSYRIVCIAAPRERASGDKAAKVLA